MAGEIADNFAGASRPGISRHLRVLKECGVVTSEREGKIQNYTLKPQPLNEIRDGWLGNFALMQTAQQVESLNTLRKRVEK